MCGIVVGLSIGDLNKKDEAMRQRLLRYFTTELLVRTEERGKDATGAAALFSSGHYVGLKRGERAANFLGTFGESKDYYGGFLKFWREAEENIRVYLGHCRQGTSGDKIDNVNNQQIKVGNLIGIHNGVIRNDDIIFEKLACKRDGKVDSEAIFRLLDHFTKGGKEPFTLDMIQEGVKRLSGQYAVSLFNADNPFQVPIFRDGRPVEFVFIKRYAILLMISEKKFWEEIHFRYERLANYYKELQKMYLPSFLGESDIEEKTLPDDSAAIFNLNTRVTKDTKIDDLCEWRKMTRAKVWPVPTIPYNSTYSSGHTNSAWHNRSTGASSTTGTGAKSKPDKKRWIFDKLSKSYIAKDGDKELSPEKSIVLPVDNNSTTTLVPAEVCGTTEDVSEDRTDLNSQSADGTKVKIEDHTDYANSGDQYQYTKHPNQAPFTGGDIIDVDPTDTEIKEAGGDVVEVEMEQYPPMVVEAAKNCYIALKNKGYGDWEELLAAVDIENKEKAESLGPVIISNRTYKVNWKDGFMAGAMWAAGDIAADKSESSKGTTFNNDKDEKREKHIANLKSLVLTMSMFFQKLQTGGHRDDAISKRLREATLDLDRPVDIEDISKVFNNHEKRQFKKVGEIIAEAEQYKK